MIYLLHSTVPVGGPGRSGARHYVGLAMEGCLEQRLLDHMKNRNSTGVVQAFLERGATLILVRTWPNGGHALERYIKKAGHFADLCPICRQENGLKPLGTLATQPMVSVPLYVTRLRRRTKVSGGVLLRGNRTDSSGSFQAELPLGPITSSESEALATLPSGGTFSPAPARQKPLGDVSVGTKPPSSSGGRKRPREYLKKNDHELEV
jgi:hypothetical protein